MTSRKQQPGSGAADSATPGKPKDSGSRQQSHHKQSTHTGAPGADREQTQRGGAGSGPKPPGAK